MAHDHTHDSADGHEHVHDHSQQYIEAVNELRDEKDDYFRAEPDSPIPPSERDTFEGLRYFPPDPSLRVLARVEPFQQRDRVTMQTSDGMQRPFERYARLHFSVDGQPLQLTAYRTPSGDPEESLFIPFRDALAGRETYGAGRYLDVETDELEREPDGTTVVPLDFNLAYNPYCAYDEHFSCPIPLVENTLPVPIRAGERAYHDE